MNQGYDIQAMARKIAQLKQAMNELKAVSGGIVVVERNVERMLASIRLLELGVSDVVDIM